MIWKDMDPPTSPSYLLCPVESGVRGPSLLSPKMRHGGLIQTDSLSGIYEGQGTSPWVVSFRCMSRTYPPLRLPE